MDNYYNKGDKVWILNRDLSGKWHVEGRATILSVAKGTERYKVRFSGSSKVYHRYVNSVAQDNPYKYIDALNKRHADLEYIDALNKWLADLVKREKETNTPSM